MFKIHATEGQARCGVLTTSGGAIDTPALLIYTHRGSPLNLTPDLLEKLKPEAQAVQLDVLQYLNQPKPEVLQQYGGSGRRFLALDDGYVLVATARDPGVYEYAGAMRQSTNEWASVTVHTGSATVTPAQYMHAVAALAPDAYLALSDDVPCDSRHDRAVKAVDRTLAWLRECLAAAAAAPGAADGGAAAAFAAVQGGQFVAERKRCAQAVAAVPGVAGYVLAGLGTGESPLLRQQIVEAVVERLPAGAPRLLSCVGTPEEVLDAVAQGIDLFDMGYLAEVTAGGYALSFPLIPEADQQQPQQQPGPGQQQAAGSGSKSRSDSAAAASAGPHANGSAASAAGAAAARSGAGAAAGGSSSTAAAAAAVEAADRGQSDSKISLWALAYRTDKRPLLPGCSCFACANHTRSYIHHLLQTHEMTAQVLLEVHNTHHYLHFFKAIRASIAAGAFAAHRDWFLQRRQRWLVGEEYS